MNVLKEARRAGYATIGAGRWAAGALHRAWRDSETWINESAGETYDRLVQRGREVSTRTDVEARRAARQAKRAARRVPGVAAVEGEIVGVSAGAEDLPLTDYDTLTVDEITDRLPSLAQRELHIIDGYERRHRRRATVLRAIDQLRGDEPWAGYDELNVEEILPRLRELAVADRATVADYERQHKNRRTVLDAAERG